MSEKECDENGPFLEIISDQDMEQDGEKRLGGNFSPFENSFVPLKLRGNIYFKKIGNCFVIMDIKKSKLYCVVGPHYPGVIASITALAMGFVAFNVVVKHYEFARFHLHISVSLAVLSCVLLGIRSFVNFMYILYRFL